VRAFVGDIINFKVTPLRLGSCCNMTHLRSDGEVHHPPILGLGLGLRLGLGLVSWVVNFSTSKQCYFQCEANWHNSY